jgi:hypothetical protein
MVFPHTLSAMRLKLYTLARRQLRNYDVLVHGTNPIRKILFLRTLRKPDEIS